MALDGEVAVLFRAVVAAVAGVAEHKEAIGEGWGGRHGGGAARESRADVLQGAEHRALHFEVHRALELRRLGAGLGVLREALVDLAELRVLFGLDLSGFLGPLLCRLLRRLLRRLWRLALQSRAGQDLAHEDTDLEGGVDGGVVHVDLFLTPLVVGWWGVQKCIERALRQHRRRVFLEAEAGFREARGRRARLGLLCLGLLLFVLLNGLKFEVLLAARVELREVRCRLAGRVRALEIVELEIIKQFILVVELGISRCGRGMVAGGKKYRTSCCLTALADRESLNWGQVVSSFVSSAMA